jgi:universal stress protein E
LLPLPEDERALLSRSVGEAADAVLGDLVKEAAASGVEATGKRAVGKGWLEIIHQVLRGKHDLVVVGTRDLTGVRRMLFGNTAMKLLRRCPCPVLVAKIGTDVRPLNVLVATDLKPAGVEAMRLAVGLAAAQTGVRLHVLHVVDYPLDRIWSSALPELHQMQYHHRIRAAAEKTLYDQLEETDYQSLGERVRVHVAEKVGTADIAIQNFIQLHNIHLLVMGTIGRAGLPGILIGNTAERLLPEVHCSVLAVKPPDFQCPIHLEDG